MSYFLLSHFDNTNVMNGTNISWIRFAIRQCKFMKHQYKINLKCIYEETQVICFVYILI
jgi:hypothetical protein